MKKRIAIVILAALALAGSAAAAEAAATAHPGVTASGQTHYYG